jgi:hypothetical protein
LPLEGTWRGTSGEGRPDGYDHVLLNDDAPELFAPVMAMHR